MRCRVRRDRPRRGRLRGRRRHRAAGRRLPWRHARHRGAEPRPPVMRSPATLLPRRRARRADRLTVGLAAVAVATAGTVIAGELARLARRRTQDAEAAEGVLDTAEQALS